MYGSAVSGPIISKQARARSPLIKMASPQQRNNPLVAVAAMLLGSVVMRLNGCVPRVGESFLPIHSSSLANVTMNRPKNKIREGRPMPKINRKLPHTFGESTPLYADLLFEGETGSYWLPHPPLEPIGGYELRDDGISSSKNNRTGFVADTHVNIAMYDGVWFSYESEGFNAGDFLAYFASPLIAGRPACMTGLRRGSGVRRTFAQGGLAVVGSIVEMEPRFVWGPGMISHPSKLKAETERVFAMRGPKSYRQMSRDRPDGSIPAVWGDLGSLMSWFYRPHNVIKKWEICIIPHYVDKEAAFIGKLQGALKESLSVLDIKGPLTDLMDGIVRCEFVLSSSLHGIIFADSYDVPNAHLELSGKVLGKGYKFDDYFESVNRTRHVLNGHDASSTTISQVRSWVAKQKHEYRKHMNLVPFWKACPIHAVAYNRSRRQQMQFAESWVESFDHYMHNRPLNMKELELDMYRDMNITSLPMEFDARRRGR